MRGKKIKKIILLLIIVSVISLPIKVFADVGSFES